MTFSKCPRHRAGNGILLRFSTALFFVASLLPAQALRSAHFADGQATYATSDLAAGDIVVEFRIHDFAPAVATNRDIFGVAEPWPLQYCRINANSLTLGCLFGFDGHPQGVTTVDLTGKTDVRVRYVRKSASLSSSIDIWDGDCANHKTSIRMLSSPGKPYQTGGSQIGIGGNGLNVDFLRVYTVPYAASTACPADAPDQPADYLDLRFDSNSLVDSSPRHHQLAASGVTYSNSPVYPPTAVIGGWTTYKPVFRAGTPFTLHGIGSATSTGNGRPVTYSWAQTNGPSLGFSYLEQNPSDPSAKIVAPLPGEYTYQLTVTDDAGTTASTEQSIGVVATDDAGVVIQENPELAEVLGPVSKHGVNLWPWYDVTEVADVDALAPYLVKPLTGCCTPMAGTVSISGTAPNYQDGEYVCCQPMVVGNGTHFLTDFSPGDVFYIWWDRDGDQSNQGRGLEVVQTIIDDTHLRIADYAWNRPTGLTQSVPYSKAGPDVYTYAYYTQPNSSWNYYDALLGIYRLHQRTGLQTYLDLARNFCNQWWQYGLDAGTRITIPRNSGWQSLMACAADNHPNWWDGIANNVAHSLRGGADYFNPLNPITNGALDVRESAYLTRATAIVAKLYPLHTSNPAQTKAQWCGYLAAQVKNIWLSNFVVVNNGQDGYWPEDVFGGNPSYPLGGNPAGTGPYGTSPWRASGLGSLALQKAYDAFNDPGSCNDSALASTILDTLRKSTSFLYDYGRSPDGGLYYNVQYSTFQDRHSWFNQNGPGSISVTAGDKTVVGSGTAFRGSFSCSGADTISINDAGVGRTFTVASCSDDTHLTLATPYSGNTRAGLSYINGGTLSVVNGSTTVKGRGTAFTWLFAPCDGTTYVGIPGTADRRVYQVTGCADDTTLTISVPYVGKTEGGLIQYSRAKQASTSCAPSIADYCEADLYNGKNLSHDATAAFAWMYAVTGESSWYDQALYFGGKAYGGPATGPGTLGPPAGPNADGNPNNFDYVLRPCGEPPCGTLGRAGGPTLQMSKPFGMSAGAGNAPNAFAYLAGKSQTAKTRRFWMNNPLFGIQPASAAITSTCCALQSGPRQGDDRMDFLTRSSTPPVLHAQP